MKKNTLKPLTPEQIENYSKNPDNIISDNDYRIIEENTLVVFEPFISNMMYDSIGAYSINCRLSRSIDLLKNGVEISPKRLIREIQNKVDCNLWDDLFCKKYFNNKVSELETDSNRFYNSYKIENDSLERKELYEFYVGAAAEVHELEETIELINEFRDLLLLAIPNLENDFKLKLHEHNERNKSETKKAATPHLKLIKQLSSNKDRNLIMQTNLFRMVIDKNLMDKNTDFDSFCFVFGDDCMPVKFKPLKWLASRQLLRELIEYLKHPDIKIPTSRYNLPPYFIDINDKQINELPTNRPRDAKIHDVLTNLAKI